MRIRIPSKKVRERFNIILMLQGSQKATDFLSKYYGIKKMKIILDGKRVKGCEAYYFENKAYFTKNGLKKRNVLHEFYHHLVDSKSLDMPERTEEKEANNYARDFLKNILE